MPNYIFGQQAIDEEVDLDARNQQVAEEMFSLGPEFSQENLQSVTGIGDNLSEYGVGADERTNTLSDIQNRFNQLGQPPADEGLPEVDTGLPPVDTGLPEGELPEGGLPETPGVEGEPTGEPVEDPYVFGLDDLGPEWRPIYDQLDEAAKKRFEQIGAEDTTAQMEFLEDRKSNDEFVRGERDRQVRIGELAEERASIYSRQRIQDSRNKLAKLKQSVAYLGTQGQPGISSARLDAVAMQIEQGNQLFGELLTIERGLKESRELGREGDAANFERQMELLQDELDRNVDSAIQDALSMMSAAELEGRLDELEDIENFENTILQELDLNIGRTITANRKQRNFLIEQYQEIAQKREQYALNKKTTNMEESNIRGYYVDGNGDPRIGIDGLVVPVKQDAVYSNYDKETGQFIEIIRGPDGQLEPIITDIMDQGSFAASQATNWASLFNQGKVEIDDIPDDIKNMPAFVQALAEGYEKEKVGNTIMTDQYTASQIDLGDMGILKVGDKAYGILGNTGTGIVTQFGGGALGGIDIDGDRGDDIYSVSGGTILDFGEDQDGNIFVEILSEDGNNVFRYNHLLEYGKLVQGDLKIDDTVQQGEKIGFMGSSGETYSQYEGGDPTHLDLGVYEASNGEKGNLLAIDKQVQAVYGVDIAEEQADPQREVYLDLLRRGRVNNSDRKELAELAVKENREKEYLEAAKEGMKTDLTETQLKQWDTISKKVEGSEVFKQADEVRGQADTVRALLSQDLQTDGFNDIALINTFQRIIDPGATVREGDVDLLQSALTLWEELAVSFNKVLSRGQKLSPGVRQSMLENAIAVYNARADYANEVMDRRYKPRADNAGLDWDIMGYKFDKISEDDEDGDEDGDGDGDGDGYSDLFGDPQGTPNQGPNFSLYQDE